MAQKTYEQLIEEIVMLKTQLKDSEHFAQASRAVEAWAKSMGYDFKVTSKTKYEDYQEVLDIVLGEIIEKYDNQIIGLREQLRLETLAADELLEAKNKLEEDTYDFSKTILDTQKRLKETLLELDEKIAKIEEIAELLEHEKGIKRKAFKLALAHKRKSEEYKRTAVDQIKEINALKKEIMDKEAAFLAEMERRDRERAYIIRNAGEYKKKYEEERIERSYVQDKIRELSGENAELKEENVKFQKIATENLYAEVVAMIVDTFNSHISEDKKKIPAYAPRATSAQSKNRQVALWKAIHDAQKLDKAKEKEAKKKGVEVIYDVAGYNKIVEEIIEKYKKIAEKYDSKSLYDFKDAYSSPEDREDGEVTDQEIINTILSDESQKPFFKSAKGIVLSAVATVLALITIGHVVTMLIRNNDEAGTQQGDEDEDDDENNNDNNNQGGTNGEQVEPSVNISVDVDSSDALEDFKALREELTSQKGGAILDVEYCEYNRLTGEVVMQFEIVNSAGVIGTETITFTMDMNSMNPTVISGEEILDFTTIGNEMIEAQREGNVVRVKAFGEQAATPEAGENNEPDNNNNDSSESAENGDDAAGPESDLSGNDPLAAERNEGANPTDKVVETPVAPVVPSSSVDVVYSVIQNRNGTYDIICKVVETEIIDGHTTTRTYASDPYEFKAGVDLETAKEYVRNDYLNYIGIEDDPIGIE